MMVLILTVSSLRAENEAELRAPIVKKSQPSISKKSEDISKPKATGVIFMISERGLEVISPSASYDLGVGQTTLTMPFLHEEKLNEEEERKQFGGIKLFGWLF